MKHITLQSDVDSSNPFTKELVDLGVNLEDFAATRGWGISGLVTPYGINCKLVGESVMFTNIEMKVTKQLQNVTTNFWPQVSPYYCSVVFSASLINYMPGLSIRIERDSLLKRFAKTLKGDKNYIIVKSHLISSKHHHAHDQLNIDDFALLDKLHSLTFDGNTINIQLNHIPNNPTEFERLISSLEDLVQKLGSTFLDKPV